MTETGADLEGLGLLEAIRHVPAAVGVFAADGTVVHVNDRARSLADQMLGRAFPRHLDEVPSVYYPDGRVCPREEWAVVRSLAGEEVIDQELVLVSADGRRAVICASSSPVRGPDSEIAAAVLVIVDVTKERSVAERLTYFERLLENTEDAIVGTDAAFRITLWNAGAERLYGPGSAEVLGRPSHEVAAYVEDSTRLRVEGALLESERTRAEFTAVRPDGTRVEVEMVAVAVRDERGQVVGYLGVHRDVSERKQTERERERFASIVRRSSDMIGIATLDGQPLYINDAGRRMVGFAGEIEQMQIGDFFAPGDRDRVLYELLPLVLEGGRWSSGTEVRLRHWQTGEEIPALCDAFRIHDPATGEPIALATVIRDISERKKAEDEREAHVRRQAAVAGLGVIALGEDDPQVVMDEALSAIAETLDVDMASVAEILPGGESLLLRAAHGFRPEHLGGAAIPLGKGSLAGYTSRVREPVISEDVTHDERFEASEALRSYGPTSAVSVIIAGHREPVGVLGAFARDTRRFSVDDVNFMQAVANVLSLAFQTAQTESRVREVRDAERRRIARDLHDEALQGLTHALAVAGDRSPAAGEDDLTTLLKIVSQQLRSAIFDLRIEEEERRPLADRLASLVAVHAARAPDIGIDLAVQDDVPALEGHQGTEVLRIVGEALNNARRHALATRIEVDVRTVGDVLRVEVADDGVGLGLDEAAPAMPPAGLQGMRERADLLSAELEVSSTPNSGLVIRLDLPLDDSWDEAAPVRILLVEDHVAVREAIAATLERQPDFRVVGQAGSLWEARTMLDRVDIALVDLGLPDGFGAELIPELRAKNPGVEAVVLSADLDRVKLARAVDRGAAGALDKSAQLDEVVEAVRRVRAGDALMGVREVSELLGYERRRQEQQRLERAAIAELTPREVEVLQAMAGGLDSLQIAARLHISPRTERNHVASILRKLPAHSRLQALVFALRYGVVEITPEVD
jgi:PAS domain S-box-containing protein